MRRAARTSGFSRRVYVDGLVMRSGRLPPSRKDVIKEGKGDGTDAATSSVGVGRGVTAEPTRRRKVAPGSRNHWNRSVAVLQLHPQSLGRPITTTVNNNNNNTVPCVPLRTDTRAATQTRCSPAGRCRRLPAVPLPRGAKAFDCVSLGARLGWKLLLLLVAS